MLKATKLRFMKMCKLFCDVHYVLTLSSFLHFFSSSFLFFFCFFLSHLYLFLSLPNTHTLSLSLSLSLSVACLLACTSQHRPRLLTVGVFFDSLFGRFARFAKRCTCSLHICLHGRTVCLGSTNKLCLAQRLKYVNPLKMT